MTPQYKVPQIDRLGEPTRTAPPKESYNPFKAPEMPWKIPASIPEEEALAIAEETDRKVAEFTRKTELHEIKDISVYKKYQGGYVRGKQPKL